jgi:hypothetical protein
MYILIVTNIEKKLEVLVLATIIWLSMFMLGSYLIENKLQFNISVDNVISFSYPYSIVADQIMSSNSKPDRYVVSSFLPTHPRIGEFINYESLEGKFSFKYPSAFIIEKAAFTGGEILYHIDFHDRDGYAHGFVQVWNFPGELGEFLDKSKETSTQTFSHFKSDDIEINGVKGILWDYVVLTDSGYYKGMEVFLKQDSRMYRLSYFLPENKWDDKQSGNFWSMAKSMKMQN